MSCTPRSTSTSCSRRGRAGDMRDVDRRRRSTPTISSARRRPGCSPTTTPCARSRATRRPRTCGRAAPARRPARPAGRLRARAAARPRRRAADARAARAAPTSTRARSSAWPRSRTCPTTRSRTRPGSSPATPSGAATAAASRSRGRATRRRSASARRTRARRRGCPSRPPGEGSPPPIRPASRARCSSSTARALALRREHPALGDGTLEWADAPPGALKFTREPGFACLVNLEGEPVALPDGWEVLLASGPLGEDGRTVPSDTAVWLRAV